MKPHEAKLRWERDRVVFACFRIEQLFQALVEYKIGGQHALFFSVITEILIQLRDLCALAAAPPTGAMLVWSDDIVPCASYSNVTDLIKFFRDGFCHSNGPFAELQNRKYSIQKSIIPGQTYEDDVAIFLGENRIFLFRHIGRAFQELRERFVEAGILRNQQRSELLRPYEPPF